MKTLSPLTFKRSKYVNKEKWKDYPTLSSFKASFLGIMERGINGICIQFCPAAPRRFHQFCGAGRGSLFFRGAGRPSLMFMTVVTTISSCGEYISNLFLLLDDKYFSPFIPSPPSFIFFVSFLPSIPIFSSMPITWVHRRQWSRLRPRQKQWRSSSADWIGIGEKL